MGESNQKLELLAYQKELLELARNTKEFNYYARQPSKSWTNKILLSLKLKNFCERNYINKLSLFGSVLTDDFASTSDIDLLVEFATEKTPGLGIVDLQDELSQMLERKVDLRTPAELSRFFRQRVLEEAVVIYDKD